MPSSTFPKTELIDGWMASAWAPPAMLNPWEWAERSLELSSRITARPGRYSTEMVPYVREILEAFADPEVRRIVLCWAAQSSKTTTLLTALAYTISNAPGPALFVFPSLDMARSFSENRLLPMINDCAELRKHLPESRYDVKKTELLLDRSTVYLAGANPNQLSSRPIRYLFLDEVDLYSEYNPTDRAADLISLGVERTKSFLDHKICVTSTPTVPSNPIWALYSAGDQRKYHVTCPMCGGAFPLEWKNIKWPKTDDLAMIEANTWLECPHCRGRLEEKVKTQLLDGGGWVPGNPTALPEVRSYHLSELYSPFSRWGRLASKFVEATGEARRGIFGPLHNFTNSSLAEPWEPREGSTRRPEELLKLCDERPRGLVPSEGVLGITAGVDVQDLGFWFVIRAWGADLESWLVREGYVETPESLLGVLFGSEYKDAKGNPYVVNLVHIDSQGHRTSEVYDLCRRGRGMAPIRGEATMAQPWTLSKLDVYPNTNRPIPGGLHLVRINTRFYKDLLSSKLQVTPGDPGAFHLHADPSTDYLNHLMAEYRNPEGSWQCSSGKRNDLWDAEVYALCAADRLGVRFWKPRTQAQEQPPQERPRPPVRGSSWLGDMSGWIRR